MDGVFTHVRNSYDEIVALTDSFLGMSITVHISLDHVSSEMPNKVIEEINGYIVPTTSIKRATTR